MRLGGSVGARALLLLVLVDWEGEAGVIEVGGIPGVVVVNAVD